MKLPLASVLLKCETNFQEELRIEVDLTSLKSRLRPDLFTFAFNTFSFQSFFFILHAFDFIVFKVCNLLLYFCLLDIIVFIQFCWLACFYCSIVCFCSFASVLCALWVSLSWPGMICTFSVEGFWLLFMINLSFCLYSVINLWKMSFTVSQHPKWHFQMSCYVQPTVQIPKHIQFIMI